MRPAAWLVRGLLEQPFPSAFELFPIPDAPEVSGPDGQVYRAVERYYRAVNAVLDAEHRAAIAAWQARQRRLEALLMVLETGDDADASALEALEATPRVPVVDGPVLPRPTSPCLSEIYALAADDERRACGARILNRSVLSDINRIDEMLNRLVKREFAAGLEGIDANEMRDADAMRHTIEQMAEAMENGAAARRAALPRSGDEQ